MSAKQNNEAAKIWTVFTSNKTNLNPDVMAVILYEVSRSVVIKCVQNLFINHTLY